MEIEKLRGPGKIFRSRYWEDPEFQTIDSNQHLTLFPNDAYRTEHRPEFWSADEVRADESRDGGVDVLLARQVREHHDVDLLLALARLLLHHRVDGDLRRREDARDVGENAGPIEHAHPRFGPIGHPPHILVLEVLLPYSSPISASRSGVDGTFPMELAPGKGIRGSFIDWPLRSF